MRKIIGYAGIVVGVAIIVAGFLAYLFRRIDPITRISYDGLGRPLSETPWFVNFVFGQSPEWAGWQWFLIDFIGFCGGIFIAYRLAEFGFMKKRQPIT